MPTCKAVSLCLNTQVQITKNVDLLEAPGPHKYVGQPLVDAVDWTNPGRRDASEELWFVRILLVPPQQRGLSRARGLSARPTLLF